MRRYEHQISYVAEKMDEVKVSCKVDIIFDRYKPKLNFMNKF
jgi:hypothetical protein